MTKVSDRLRDVLSKLGEKDRKFAEGMLEGAARYHGNMTEKMEKAAERLIAKANNPNTGGDRSAKEGAREFLKLQATCWISAYAAALAATAEPSAVIADLAVDQFSERFRGKFIRPVAPPPETG